MCQPDPNGLRIVITGKGGVGKTTLAACLATALAEGGYSVLAVDEDPQMNLPHALGLDGARVEAIVPLNRHADYIEEKTGIRPGRSGWGSLFKLNPDVHDVVERVGVRIHDRLSLLVMGTVRQAGGGCLCAENVLLDATIRHLALRPNEAILLDTQAGMEHFGRALSRGFGHCLVVADNSFNALDVACQSARLARQIGIPLVHLLLNRADARSRERLARFEREQASPLDRLFTSIVEIPRDAGLEELDPAVCRVMGDDSSPYASAVRSLASLVTAPPCYCSSAAGSLTVHSGDVP